MKRFLLFLFLPVLSFAQNIQFSDFQLEQILLNTLTYDSNSDGLADLALDVNGDGIIQQSEVSNVDALVLSSGASQVSINDLAQFPILSSLKTNTISSLSGDLSNLSSLGNLDISGAISISINLSSNTLHSLTLNNNMINADFTNLPALERLDLSGEISNLNLSNNSLLQELKITHLGGFPISTPDISGCSVIKKIELFGSFTGAELITTNNPQLKNITIFENQFTSNNILSLTGLEELRVRGATGPNLNVTSLDFSNNPSLKILQFEFCFPLLSSLNLTGNGQLEDLRMNNLNLPQLNLINNVNLKVINIKANQNLSLLDLSNAILLENLVLEDIDNLATIDISQNLELRAIDLIDLPLIQNCDVTNNLNLEWINLIILPNYSSNIDVSQNASLVGLRIAHTAISSLDVSNNPLLENIYLNNTSLIELNLQGQNNIFQFDITNNMFLERIYFKTGNDISNGITFSNLGSSFFQNVNPNLNFICARSNDIEFFENLVGSSTVVNSYCSFNPGGSFNEIQGVAKIDVSSNGCDPNSPTFSNLMYVATNDTSTGSISSDFLGSFYIPVSDGQHTITPQPENPSYWNFSPASITVDFPTQTSPFTQDFCVTPNGTIEDLEIIVTPIEQARPGFETDYKVMVKNKGNQNASGTVTLDYDADYMALFDSAPVAGTANSGQLDWSFTDIAPFQMEEYRFTMTLNTPTDSNFPLNGDDELSFTGTVTGTGTDNMPTDNTMTLEQIVVNSYDPNDKRCLEGEKIEPSMVGEYVHYMIRFENTGTASAINVVVKDAIDPTMFDVSTFVPLGGSHDYYVRSVEDGNTFEFIHENINLDFNDATNDGYVLFKIKTLPTLSEGDTFNNEAEIYFDFNAPIVTNDFVTTVQSTASVSAITDDSINISPNPTSGILQLNAQSAIQSLTVHDLNGRILNKTSFVSGALNETVNLENLNSGIYLMTVETSEGHVTERVVIE